MGSKKFDKLPDDIVIVAAARTPIARFGGSLKTVSAIDMGALVVREAVARAGIAPEAVSEVIIGQVGSWGENGFVARSISLKAGLPDSTCAYSVNRQCGSGLQSIVDGCMELQTGAADVVVAGGAESLSQLPYYVPSARWGARMGHRQFEDGVLDILTWPLDGSHNGTTAENVAREYGVSREEQDAFAARSQQRACEAVANKVFAHEIVPVEVQSRKGVTIFDTDEGPREGVTAEGLAKLRPCFVTDGTGTVTAGNSSSLNDGAAAVVLMKRSRAEELGCTPMVTVRGHMVVGCAAATMGYAPFFSTTALCKRLGITPSDIDFFELNEAFASQAVAVSRDLKLDENRVNVYGGGISLGHPIGATGTVLTVKCAYELAERHPEKEDAMVSMCIGGGQGISLYMTRG